MKGILIFLLQLVSGFHKRKTKQLLTLPKCLHFSVLMISH